MPELSPSALVFFERAYGALLLATLLMTMPHGRRFFVSERWHGYAQSTPSVDAVQNPLAYPFILTVWLAAAALIALGWWTLWAALINLVLCRYFFVHMRWKSATRGMGAPGFMTYWLALALFLLTLSRGQPDLQGLALLALQADFAFIMLSAGIYKLSAGYARNNGMEYGLANPEWGYWWRWYSRLPPDHWLFKTLNHLAWTTEVVAAILMLIPQTRLVGSALIIVSFIFIATQIRLGFLCEMVIVAALLYCEPGSLGDLAISRLAPAAAATDPALFIPWAGVGPMLKAALLGYLILLPLAHGGLFYNFYTRKPLPRLVQLALDRYTNVFGIIIWRVFSVDIVNFYILVHHQPRAGGPRTLISRYGWLGGLRYGHVGESITLTSVFTTLKYYPSNHALFAERILRYARSVPHPSESVLVFQYVSLRKTPKGFAHVPVAEFLVDVTTGRITEQTIDPVVSVRAPHPVSPVHEGLRPGTYAPAES